MISRTENRLIILNDMKRFFTIAVMLLLATAAQAQIKFSADFESGSMEKAVLVSQETKNGTETIRC